MANPRRGSGKVLPLTIVAVLAGLIGLIGYIQAGPDGEAGRYYYRCSGGAVLFEHAAHQDQVGECQLCHHEMVGGFFGCDPEFTADMLDHAELVAIEDHSCDGCHEIADDDQARGCRACHPAGAVEGEPILGCDGCHDDPEYAPGLVTHGELLEIEGHECEGCHTARAVADAYHSNCNACHLAEAPERFADPEGKALCAACHLK